MTSLGSEFHGLLVGSSVPSEGDGALAQFARAAWMRLAGAVRRMGRPRFDIGGASPESAKEMIALRDSSVDRRVRVS
jgi:hypothetical protein